ncbi:hypothetical protein F356_141 [Campylobacter phage F356]|uniref:Uncharacterized protein n=2 Tax=Fletchervirus CPX TaxID=1110702 RepID=A0A7T3KES6_9CAUD|nr:hypothetical protein F355_055 [Campylobacter phage F355]QPX63779.1 hypothetical protein F356_141 [Campylobacter phage F356]
MNKKQFNEIKERLEKYRERKNLTYENQQEKFLGNVFEKVSEYFRAKDDLERVDALCYIAMFYLNSFDIKYNSQNFLMTDDINIHSVINRSYNMMNVTSTRTYSVNSNGYSFIAMLENFFNNLGFNFDKCMLEIIKEIESRTGHYDESLNKFIKDEGYYSVAHLKNEIKLPKIYKIIDVIDKDYLFLVKIKTPNTILTNKFKKWYKPNYENCRLKNKNK